MRCGVSHEEAVSALSVTGNDVVPILLYTQAHLAVQLDAPCYVLGESCEDTLRCKLSAKGARFFFFCILNLQHSVM